MQTGDNLWWLVGALKENLSRDRRRAVGERQLLTETAGKLQSARSGKETVRDIGHRSVLICTIKRQNIRTSGLQDFRTLVRQEASKWIKEVTSTLET